MKLLHSALIVLIATSAAPAFADDSVADNSNGSQFFYQSPSGALELTPTLSGGLTTITLKNGPPDKAEISRSSEKLMLAYGINEMFSVSGELAFTRAKTSVTPNPTGTRDTEESGLENPTLAVRGRVPVGNGTFRFGAELGFALEDSKTQTNGDSNASTGGTSLAPFIGFEMPVTPDQIVGARLIYGLNLTDPKSTDESNSPTTHTTTSGGEAFGLDGFYEVNVSKVRIGADLGVIAVKPTTTKRDGQSRDNQNPMTAWHLGVYTPVTITKTIVILPTISYTKLTAFNHANNIDTDSSVTLEVAARFTF